MGHRFPNRGLTVVASVVLLLGCRDRSVPRTQAIAAARLGEIAVSSVDSSGVQVVTISGSVDSLPEWSLAEAPITEIRSNAAPFIGSVGEVAFFGNEQLLVEDNQTAELRVFGADGREVRLLGAKGDGPGEFRWIRQLSVTRGDTVYAFDYQLQRLSSFDRDGALVTTMAIRDGFAGPRTFLEDAWALGSDRLVLLGRRRDPRESGGPMGPIRLLASDGIVGMVSPDGTALVPPVEMPGGSLMFGDRLRLESPFSNHPVVTTNGERVVSGSGRTYELALRDPDFRPLTVVRWSGWARPMDDALVESLRDPMKASLELLRGKVPPNVVDGQLRILEHMLDPELRPDTLPALGSVRLDEDGRVWVARFRPPDDFFAALSGGRDSEWHQEDVWHVLDADGTPIARVRLPPETRLLAVRSDRVAVVTRDDLGAESVRVLRINKPAQ